MIPALMRLKQKASETLWRLLCRPGTVSSSQGSIGSSSGPQKYPPLSKNV